MTGRVIITRSRNEQHSYRAWYWFYMNVLVRHQLGTAAGTTSSSAYRMATYRRRDTFADDCVTISSRYTRRRDGPMARSEEFSAFIAETPRTARRHAPMTMRTTAAAPALVARLFPGHRCRIATATAADWYACYVALEDGTGACGCPLAAEQVAAQLKAALGSHRLARIHGPEAAMHGHTLECEMVGVPPAAALETWTRERERVEVGLAGGGEYTLADVFRPHLEAGCFAANDIDWKDMEAVGLVACHYIAQLHLACHDFDNDPEDDSGGSPAPPPPTTVLALDEVIDHEARYRLDALRGGDVEADTSFSLDPL